MKKNIHVLLMMLAMILASLKSYAQDPNFHIYLCFGQSNMEGMGTIEAQDRTTNARVKVLQDQTCSNLNRVYGTWYTAAPPLNRCWSGLGPADYFGKTMADATPSNVSIGLIPAAVSGCDIAFFQKGAPLGKASVSGGGNADIPAQFTGGYEWIVDMVTKAKKVGVIKGIIFHQGETNTGDPNWKYKVQGIVNNLRTDLGLGNIPFLAGELLYGQYGSCCSSHNAEVNKIPAVITNSYVISASGLPGKDVAHFTSASYRILGWRYAQQMLAIENTGCTPTPVEPYTQTDGVNWMQQATVKTCVGGTIKLAPHPADNSGWSWTGPNNFTAATREITLAKITAQQAGIYTATYINAGGCVSTSKITVTVNPLPVVSNHIQMNGGTWDPLDAVSTCTGNTIALGPWPVAATGWSWTGPNGFSGTSRELNFTNLTAAQSGMYKSTYTDENGCSASLNFSLTVNPKPNAPTVVTPVTYCQNASASVLTAAGTALKWYTGASGGTALVAAPVPATATVGTTNYYVSQTANGCESSKVQIAVTVNALPNAPTVVTPVTYCQNSSASALTTTGASLKWYTTATGGTALPNAPTPVTTAVGTTNYYVSQTANGCESSRASIAVTINALPNVPAVMTPVTYCQNAPASALTATGASLKWYTVATGGTALANAPTPVTTAAGTTNYYVSQTSNGCESSRAFIAVTVNALPTATITASGSTNICQGSAVILTASSGSSYSWKNGSTVVGTNQTYSAIVSGNYSVEVSNGSNCKATSPAAAVTVSALPNVPAVITPITYCQNASASVLAATGTSLKWYTVATGEATLANAPTPVTTAVGTTNYYVSQSFNGCESSRAPIAVTVNALPTATITASGAATVCQGATVTLTASSGSSYVWKNGTTVVGTNQTYSAIASGNYSVEVTNASNCKATSSLMTITMNDAVTWYADADGDGAGDAVTQSACSKPAGYVATAGDGCPADADKIAAGNCGCGNTENSCLDCAGVPNGTAAMDVCNRCSGGTTGITPVTDPAACTSTGVVDLAATNAIKILPNPSSDQFTLLLMDTSTVHILTVDGKLVEVFENVHTLNFGSGYAKGVYVVQINNALGAQVLRVIKQ